MNHDTPASARVWRLRFLLLVALLIVVPGLIIAYVVQRFGGDTAVVYADPAEHFKYGSTGGEHESGFPYGIFQALPQVCAQQLPGPGTVRSGLIYEDGKDLPVGMSRRRYQGVDRTFLNCAVCHASTVRETADAKPRLLLGMPANTFDIMGFQKFLFDCAADPEIQKEYVIPETRPSAAARRASDLDLVDRYVVYPVAIGIMRERLLMLRGRFEFVLRQLSRSLGARARGHFQLRQGAVQLSDGQARRARELIGPVGFPVDLEPAAAQGHAAALGRQQHDRSRSATRAPPSAPAPRRRRSTSRRIERVEDWLLTLKPPTYPVSRSTRR